MSLDEPYLSLYREQGEEYHSSYFNFNVSSVNRPP